MSRSHNDEPYDQVAIMGDWAFWIDKSAPVSERFMVAPVEGEDKDINFSKRTSVDASILSDADIQALFNVLDFLGKKVDE